jgi:glutamine synthetase
MTDRLTFIATCDLVALTRGRALRSDEYERRRAAGVGWVPADLALTTFGDIASPNPFGSLGDLRLLPDDRARIVLPAVAGRPPTDLVLADIVETDGSPWACDPRAALADALRRLEARGLRLVASFEQEFGLTPGDGPAGGRIGSAAPFSLEAHRWAEPFGSELVGILADQGLAPETWLPEYGAGQYEITLAPTDGLLAADRAILVRAVVRDLASAQSMHATFAPLVRPEAVGNGVHIHLSLWDLDGTPVTLDATGALTGPAGSFSSGIVDHAAALVGWTAPSVVSALRLAPHRWSSAAAFVGRQNREAMLRICPVPTVGGGDPLAAANLEFRACDATANPWLALAAVVRAGLDGLDRALSAPAVVDGELDALDDETRDRLGIRPLPVDLEGALAAIESDDVAVGWFAPDLLATHLAIRRTELAILAGATPEERCRRYADVV